MLHLFGELIKPILVYAFDFWGYIKLPEYNPVENLHIRICKELLRVEKQTDNVAVLLDLRRVPLIHFRKKTCTENWERTCLNSKANILLLEDSASTKIGWPKVI